MTKPCNQQGIEFKHSNTARVTSLDHFGDYEENVEMYDDLVAALKAFDLNGSDLNTHKVYAYDSDGESRKFKQISKANGVRSADCLEADDLLRAGFKRIEGPSTSTVFLKGNTVLLLAEDDQEVPPMYLIVGH